ncbi:hypothetical protein [Agaribacter flavus]|uniref:Glycosyltransferase RgtA/B/C/D-like domain-containing protein n=1 Tax=Agaribacter flavus TaxID=1902781 RepID=A0ABV7FT47_9ALTE
MTSSTKHVQTIPANIAFGLIVFSGISFFIFWSVLTNTRYVLGDEAWGAAAVLGNIWEVAVFTIRWDLHPPLYYMALDLWAVISKSDLWLRLFSGTLHTLSAAFTYLWIAKRYSSKTAAICACLVFFNIILLEYSMSIRMYSWVCLLSLIVYFKTSTYRTKPSKANLVWIFTLELMLVYSHAIGLAFVFFHFVFGLIGLWQLNNRLLSRQIVTWAVSHVFIALLSLPVLANSMIKSAGHAYEPSLFDAFSLLNSLFISHYLIFGLLLSAVLLFGIIKKQFIVEMVCYLLLPIITFFLISIFVKPMWLSRNFVFALPILSICLGVIISQLRIHKLMPIVILVPFMVLNALSLNKIYNDYPNQAFENVISIVNTKLAALKKDQQLCVVSTAPLGQYWTLNRYLNGNEWGNPMFHQPPLNHTWQAVSDKLPQFAKTLLYIHSDEENVVLAENMIISSHRHPICDTLNEGQVLYVGKPDWEKRSIKLLSDNKFAAIYVL